MIIYKITNTINGKVYIGKTTTSLKERFNKHKKQVELKTNRHLYDSMNKYGIENFKIKEIDNCKSNSELTRMEKFWIRIYGSADRTKGYNLTTGGDGGDTFSRHTEKEKQKILMKRSVSMLGKNKRKRTQQEKEHLSQLYLGKTYEQIHGLEKALVIKKKISDANKIIQNLPEIKEKKIKGMKGKTRTLESRKKMSVAQKGRIVSEKTKNKISKARKGVPWSIKRRLACKKKGIK